MTRHAPKAAGAHSAPGTRPDKTARTARVQGIKSSRVKGATSQRGNPARGGGSLGRTRYDWPHGSSCQCSTSCRHGTRRKSPLVTSKQSHQRARLCMCRDTNPRPTPIHFQLSHTGHGRCSPWPSSTPATFAASRNRSRHCPRSSGRKTPLRFPRDTLDHGLRCARRTPIRPPTAAAHQPSAKTRELGTSPHSSPDETHGHSPPSCRTRLFPASYRHPPPHRRGIAPPSPRSSPAQRPLRALDAQVPHQNRLRSTPS